MHDSLATLNSPGLPSALSLLVIVLAAYVTLDMGHRAHKLGASLRNPWLLGAALGLSAGIWSAQYLALCGLLSPFSVGFHPVIAGAAWALALACCVAGLRCVLAPAPARLELIAGAALLALGALATQMLALSSLGVRPQISWHFGRLGLAWLVCAGGLALAIGVFAPARERTPATARRRQLAASMIVGVAVMACQSLAMDAAALSSLTAVADDALVSSGAMSLAASIGGAELLLLMLLGCAVEARVRGSLESARFAMKRHTLRDDLTGLPNRSTFEGTLSQALQKAEAQNGQLVLLLIALDGFKHVNDSFGHQQGDMVLKRMAQRLRTLAQPHMLARLGGDEFLMLHAGDDAQRGATALAAKVLESIGTPCLADGRDVGISCSIGMAVYPQHGAMSALITHASIAMRASKSSGGATYSFFDARMVNNSRDQAELLRDLRLALAREQLELYYQPKIHAPSGQITGAEALLRWHHPQRGMISPTLFIPMAERGGVINTLGAWVIDEACRQARVWRDVGLRMRVAVNLSAHQLRQCDLPQRIAQTLAKHQVNPDLLTCEITESVAMEDTEATMRVFTELAAVGVHISIDDFGSGYSSLAYLRKLPATELKIDRSFVLDLESSEEARKIAAAVVNLAQALNLKVVAEGVETEAQFQILREFGCNELQGFLFAKPMSAKALTLWAMAGDGPRSIQFSESLFQATNTMAL
jgi:diguanylate cyclase (GGDEF)-like protein